MPTHQTFVTQLLRAYHRGAQGLAGYASLPSLSQVGYLCDVGLGPIAFHTYGDLLRESDPEAFSLLQAADLTTRVIYGQHDKATTGLLSGLHDVGVTPVLLKGISTAKELYSPSHLRLMGDVDVLIEQAEIEPTMTVVADLGYEIADEKWLKYHQKDHHHLPEARNQKSGVSIEVHTGLFVPGDPFAKELVFQPDNIEEQIVDIEYNAILARRFTPEFQFVYTIAHWAVDSKWAANLSSINDVIHMLRREDPALDWPILTTWLHTNPWLYPCTVTLASYLKQADIITVPPQLDEALAKRGHALAPGTLKLLTWLLHNYPCNAREKSHDEYADWRACQLWQELIKPNSRDIRIPYALLRTALRSIHHGRYNPFGWLLSVYRYLTSRLGNITRTDNRA